MDKLPNVAPSSRQEIEPSTSSTPRSEKLKRMRRVTEMATNLFRAYPKTDYDDPDAALANMIVVLSSYTDAIIREVTSLETGLQRKSIFPPRIAEIVKACETIAARDAQRKRFEEWGKPKEQMALGPPPHERPTREELLAKHGGSLLPKSFGKTPEEIELARKREKEALEPQAVPWAPLIEHYHDHPQRLANLTGEIGTRRSLRQR